MLANQILPLNVCVYAKIKKIHLVESYGWQKVTLRIWDNLKNDETIDICNEFGDFQLGTGSTCCHFLSSIKDINASLSRVPLYCLNSPFNTLENTTSIYQHDNPF